MKKIEAIALLAACKPLAQRLVALGVNIELTDEDRTALKGFDKVWLSSWLDAPDIHQLTGLSQSDINLLNFVASVEITKKMRQQHQSREPLDD